MPTEPSGRRPLKSRDLPLFKNLAAGLARAGATPNGISFASILFGCCAGAALAGTSQSGGSLQSVYWLVAAVAIQLRLIANLLDGMVAVEGRKGGPTGDLWNEAPDRVSDAAIFIGAGYAAGSLPALGYAAALMAVFVAYVRALGASVGAGQCFLGPQAKPQRMALMTGVCVLSAIVPRYSTLIGEQPLPAVALALWIVIVGGAITAWRRLAFIADFLRRKANP
jgi:phosphatidylglycerophosphate synthase